MSRMRMTLRRGALLATVLAAVLVVGVQAASARELTAAKKAATWLGESGQLTEGTHVVTKFNGEKGVESFVDVGSTIDDNFAFLTANFWTTGNYETQIAATAKWIGEHGSEYIGGGTCSPTKTGELFAGSTAKLAVFELADEASPSATIAQLECLEATTGTEKGRFNDQSSFGNFSNTFGQSFGVIALEEAGKATPLENAVGYLVSQQCTGTEAGAFRESLGNTSTACTAGQGEVDSTAMAAQALIAAGKTTQANKALKWLEKQAKSNASGVFWESSACTGVAAPSVNSTALESIAAGEPGVAEAAKWLAAQQNTAGWLEGCSDPSAEVLNSNRVRATNQAVLGLVGVGYLDLATGVYAP